LLAHTPATAHLPLTADLELQLQVLEGEPRAVAVALMWPLDDWSAAHHLLLPDAVYAGNRFQARRISYPPIVTAPEDTGPDAPLIIADLPRLNYEHGPSRLNLLTGDLTTPAVGVFSPLSQRGAWLLTDQGTRLGNTGLDFKEKRRPHLRHPRPLRTRYARS